MTQVQVGCLEHCYGTTTLDTSGLTLAQIEQLLGELEVPSPPDAIAAPGSEQNSTQQAAAQSENNEGNQSQAAGQTNRTVQVVGTPGGAPTDGGTGPATVNQTAQGIAQLQVGCIFYCSGTQQTQQAQQSNATVQSVDGSGAGAVNTVSQVVWQVQVGCLVWCDDAVETQTASGTDSTVVAVAPPPDVPAATVPPPPGAPVASALPPGSGARTRDSGGAPVRVLGAGLGAGSPDAGRAVLRAHQVTAVSGPAGAANGRALVSLATSQTIQTELMHGGLHRAQHVDRHGRAPRPGHAARNIIAGAGPSAVARTSTTQPDLDLAVALVLAGLGFGVWRWRGVR
ncbi:MAG: hypothetical protein ACRDPM_05050 [Solirubrobacteraceae bacterium]